MSSLSSISTAWGPTLEKEASVCSTRALPLEQKTDCRGLRPEADRRDRSPPTDRHGCAQLAEPAEESQDGVLCNSSFQDSAGKNPNHDLTKSSRLKAQAQGRRLRDDAAVVRQTLGRSETRQRRHAARHADPAWAELSCRKLVGC